MALHIDDVKVREGSPVGGFDLGAIEDVTADVSFGIDRTVDGRVLVTATVHLEGPSGDEAAVTLFVGGQEVARASVQSGAGGLASAPDVLQDEILTVTVAAGEPYRLENTLDPNATNAIVRVAERSL